MRTHRTAGLATVCCVGRGARGWCEDPHRPLVSVRRREWLGAGPVLDDGFGEPIHFHSKL